MSITQVACPECGAKLSSKAGFTAGQRIRCPKCQEAFAVPAAPRKPVAVDEDDDDELPVKKKPVVREVDDEAERPKKKKKKGTKGGRDREYVNSPLRFIVLGGLVVIMLVLGYFLYRKFTAPPLPDIVIPARNAGD